MVLVIQSSPKHYCVHAVSYRTCCVSLQNVLVSTCCGSLQNVLVSTFVSVCLCVIHTVLPTIYGIVLVLVSLHTHVVYTVY